MSTNEAPFLVVAGVHNEMSLGWAAAQHWLDRDTNNEVVVTVRNPKSQEFIEAKNEEYDRRIEVVPGLDWTERSAINGLRAALSRIIGDERLVSGAVHSIAHAPAENFVTPAHELDMDVYLDTYKATALSLVGLVQGSIDRIRPSGGIVTYGFSEYGRLQPSYGPALSTAKVALSHLIKELAGSLGQTEPCARTAEIVTSFIPTYAGRGFLAGVGEKRGKRLKPADEEAYLASQSVLQPYSSDKQRENAGKLAVELVADPLWEQTTGARFEINAGWQLKGREMIPPADTT